MCDCSQDPNLFRGGGDPIRIFFIQLHRDGAFSKRPAVIQCIREIKASPHSCLLADRLLEKPARGGSGRIVSFLLLYLIHRFYSSQPHSPFQTSELDLISFITVMIRCLHSSYCALHGKALSAFLLFLRQAPNLFLLHQTSLIIIQYE